MRWIGVLLTVLLLTADAFAADAAPTEKPDARLDRKVTIEVTQAKLQDVAQQLTEQAGVTIKAGTGERDWKVRERKITIQAKDVPLGTLVHEISKLLGFYLSKSGKEGEWSYLYWQDLKGRLLESEMLNAQNYAALQRAVASRQTALDAADEALAMTSEDALKLRDKDPWRAYLGGTKSGRGLAQILSYFKAGSPDEVWDMLHGYGGDINKLSPDIKQAITDMLDGISFGGDAELGSEEQGYSPIQPRTVSIEPMRSFGGHSGPYWLEFGCRVQVMGAQLFPDGKGTVWNPMGYMLLPSPGSEMERTLGEMALQVADIVEGRSDPVGSMNMSFPVGPPQIESPTEKDPPTDPALTREVEIKGITEDEDLPVPILFLAGRGMVNPEYAGRWIAEISRAIGMPVLLESFGMAKPLDEFLETGNQPLYKVLIALEKAGYTWTFSENVLRIRPEDWAVQRSFEISEAFLEDYEKRLEEQGEFSLDDVSSLIGALTDNQIDNTLLFDAELSPALPDLPAMNRSILRLHDLLTEAQKLALSSKDGLQISNLDDKQWSIVSSMTVGSWEGVFLSHGSIKLAVTGRKAVISVYVHTDVGHSMDLPFSIKLPSKEQIAAAKQARDKQVEKGSEEKSRR